MTGVTKRASGLTFLVPGGWLALIFLLAMAWRLVLFRGGVPFVDVDLRGDEGNYFALARGLLETGQFVDRWPWTRPPLYPALLSLVFSFSHYDVGPVVLAQSLMGALSAVMVAFLAAGEYGRRAGLLAGLIAAVDPTAPVQVLYLFSEGTSMPLALLGAITILKGLRSGKGGWFAAAGVALGIGALVRVTLLPIGLAFGLWLVFGQLRRRMLPIQGLILLLALLATLAPWSVRNWGTYHRLVLVDTTLGVNLYQYNSDLSRREVYNDLMRIPNPAERQAYGMAMAARWITSHPREFLLRALERLRYSWTADRYSEWAIALKAKVPEAPSWMTMAYASIGTLWYLGIFLAAALGAGLAIGSPYRMLVLVAVATYMVITVFVESAFRYKLSLFPFLFPLAAVAIGRWRWRWGLAPYGAAGFLVVGLSVPLIWPALPRDVYAHVLYLQGRFWELAGDGAKSEQSYSRAMEVDARADFYMGLARVMASRGRGLRAQELLEEAEARWAEDPRPCGWQRHLARLAGDGVPACNNSPLLAAAATRWSWNRLPLVPRSSVSIGEDDLGYVTGVYAPEGDGGMHRWTSEEATVRLWAPSRRLVLGIRCTTGPLPAATFEIEVSGVPVGVVEAPQGQWTDVRLPLPGIYRPGELIEVTLRSQRINLQPDGRRLGVVISHVGLESAD